MLCSIPKMLITILLLVSIPLAFLVVVFLVNYQKIMQELSTPSFGSTLMITFFPIYVLASTAVTVSAWAIVHLLLCAILPDNDTFKDVWASAALGALSGLILYIIPIIFPYWGILGFMARNPVILVACGAVGAMIYYWQISAKHHTGRRTGGDIS